MSLHDYYISQQIPAALAAGPGEAPTFNALLMAAIQHADLPASAKLQLAFPEIWSELSNRFFSPDGLLEGERVPAVEQL